MRILLSNDDGYFAPGLAALAEGLAPLGTITVVAPERDRSGSSNSLTLDRPRSLYRAANGFRYVNGTPTDCLHMAVTGLLDFKPDVIVTRNPAGAQTGRLLGIPAIFDTDDGKAAGIHCWSAAPFAHVITTPDCSDENYGRRHVKYPGY